MSVLVDLVKIQIGSTGTGAFSLGPAVPGFRGVEALTDGATYSYSVQLGGNFEAGTGVYLAASASLTRSPSISSNGGATVAFGPTAQVSFVALAQDIAPPGSTINVLDALGTSATNPPSQRIVTTSLQNLSDILNAQAATISTLVQNIADIRAGNFQFNLPDFNATTPAAGSKKMGQSGGVVEIAL